MGYFLTIYGIDILLIVYINNFKKRRRNMKKPIGVVIEYAVVKPAKLLTTGIRRISKK